MGKHSQYGVILDAGSSGTRVYIYKWKNPAHASHGASPTELQSLPKLELKKSKKIHPGVASYADTPKAVGSDHLKQLIKVATDVIPDDKIAETPVYLLATAGVRFLPKFEQTRLLGEICAWLQTSTHFDLPDCGQHVQVISGETEGLYGWIAANYLLGGFDYPQGQVAQNHHTFGFLDMGGASAQIAFAPNSTEAEKHSNDLKLVRMRHLDGSAAEYRVFTTTWLGFGANKARERYLEHLTDQYGDGTNELPDPCMPRGLITTLDGTPVMDKSSADETRLVGTGKFDECLRQTYPLLEKDAPCDDDPCLLNGQHVPAIDFNINRFVGVSEYWHTTHSVFGGKDQAYDLETYQRSVLEYCSREWADISSDILDKRKSAESKAEDAQQACFKASWLINMLYDGIGIPRLGLDATGSNVTQDDLAESSDPFQPVDKIDGIELSWTLGKMLLYAAGQVPSEPNSLPVGFGTNVASGTPDDFEPAGSVPLFPVASHDEDDDDNDDELLKYASKKSSGAGLVAFIVILLLIGFIFRKSVRRSRLWNFARRRRSWSGRKQSRGGSVASKLFGRGPHYERVMEEGEATEFELGGASGANSDALESDSSDSSRSETTPKLNAERFADEMRAPSSMDRQGFAVRTESREKLVGVGRRSRTGSPQRQRSPLAPTEQ